MIEFAQKPHSVNLRFSTYRTLIIIALVAGIAVNAILFAYLVKPKNAPLPSSVLVTHLIATGSTMLCPGDTLEYEYHLDATQPSVVDVSIATLPIEAGISMYAGDTERQPIPAPSSVHFRGEWVLPSDIKPGEYVRVIAISSPGRYAVAFGTLSFKVVECETEE